MPAFFPFKITVNFKIIFLADVGSGNPLQYSCLGNPMV